MCVIQLLATLQQCHNDMYTQLSRVNSLGGAPAQALAPVVDYRTEPALVRRRLIVYGMPGSFVAAMACCVFMPHFWWADEADFLPLVQTYAVQSYEYGVGASLSWDLAQVTHRVACTSLGFSLF